MNRPGERGVALPIALVFIAVISALVFSLQWSVRREALTVSRFNDRMAARIMMEGIWTSFPDMVQSLAIDLTDDKTVKNVKKLLPVLNGVTWIEVSTRPYLIPSQYLVYIELEFKGVFGITRLAQEARVEMVNDSCRILDVDER
ncbi:hypothetical protein JXA80_14680 [bacterium]|nr:hypothetical protein [candidate division CSSED10-310 bacterium]